MKNITFYRNVFLKFIVIILPIYLSTSFLICSEEVTYYSSDLPVPVGLSATANISSILLTWDALEGDYNYFVYRKIDTQEFVKINGGLEVLSNQYEDFECTQPNGIDTPYDISYMVSSTKDSVESDLSGIVIVHGNCSGGAAQ